jgi:protein TonB
MNHSLKAFIISASLYVTLFGAVIFYKPIKEEKKKIVVIDMNMVENITQIKKVDMPKEISNTEETKKQEESKEEKKVEKKIVKKLSQPKKKKIQKKLTKIKKIQPKTKPNNENDIKRIKSGESYQEQYMKTNLANIIAAIKRHKNYPHLAKKKEIEGKVILKCIITPKGGVKDIKFVKKSSSSILNQNSIDILKKASKEFITPLKEIEIIIPFNYELIM